ncbi:MAG: hypothetical protein HKN58_09060 [Xanthomonadales bacterium]|nr:hypothetical protein [Xanthomonadales bacterium]
MTDFLPPISTKTGNLSGRQKGGLTIFTGIFVLILMTLMLLYATRVGLFEQRVSANEMRQKIAFHAAESAIEQGLEYVLANGSRVFQDDADAASDGAGGSRAGWFANDGTTPGWQACTAALIAMDNHPCGGDIPAAVGSFFYDDPATGAGTDSLPIDTSFFAADTTARLSMVMCIVDFNAPAAGCLAAPATEDDEREAVAVIQLLAYGFTDCTDTTDITTCTAEARISRPLSNYKNFGGAPAVPLTTKSTFPPTGTAEVVPNPNAGGVGVPISVWSNENAACSAPPAVTGQGSWATCELHEWYGRDARPDDVSCDITPCTCTVDEAISYTSGQTTYQGIDIIADDSFPCDLFEFYFGVQRNRYEVIKGAATVVEDCSGLNEYTSGLYWVSGSTCAIAANTQVGSPTNPIILVSAAGTTRINGGAEIFGVLYIFDGEDSAAELDSAGTNTVYGAVIVDATMGNYNGTFQIVYSEAVLANATGNNGLGHINSGWRDFGLPDWQ